MVHSSRSLGGSYSSLRICHEKKLARRKASTPIRLGSKLFYSPMLFPIEEANEEVAFKLDDSLSFDLWDSTDADDSWASSTSKPKHQRSKNRALNSHEFANLLVALHEEHSMVAYSNTERT